MKYLPFTFAAAGIAMIAAGPALAGGLSEPAPQPVIAAPVPVVATPVGADWTGLYGGLSLGYGDVTGSSVLGDDVTGMTYGAHVGYMYDLGSFVLGGELEYEMGDITDDSIGLDVDSVLRGKLRLGYDAGRVLPYLAVGGAQLTTSGAVDDSDTGYFYGVGLDYQMTDSIRLGAEVLQHEFNDYADTGIDVSATTFAARVSFSF